MKKDDVNNPNIDVEGCSSLRRVKHETYELGDAWTSMKQRTIHQSVGVSDPMFVGAKPYQLRVAKRSSEKLSIALPGLDRKELSTVSEFGEMLRF